MGKVTQVKNGKYIGADKYTITDTSDGKKQITFSPDQVLEQGTPVGAEILNEIQRNGLYYLTGTHRVNGQESIYDCTLAGIDTFEFAQLNVLFKPNMPPTQATVKLNISGQIFTLAEKLINANQIGLLLVKSEMKAYTWGTKIAIVNDLATGGADKALSAEMGKKLHLDSSSYFRRQLVGVVDFDTITEPGVYECSAIDITSSFKNVGDKKPIVARIHPWGCFEVIPFGDGNILQRYTPASINEGIFATITRMKYFDQSWGVWLATIHQNSKEFNSFVGAGSESQFSFIQDVGTKNANSLYYDNATFALYRCIKTNQDVTVTTNFEKVSILDNLNKIKNLVTTSTITSTKRVQNAPNTKEWIFEDVKDVDKIISVVLSDIQNCQLESYVIEYKSSTIYVTAYDLSSASPQSVTIKVAYLNI